MERISKLAPILLEGKNNIYLKSSDFKLNEARSFIIVNGKHRRIYFNENRKPICVSEDTLHGIAKKSKKQRLCAECKCLDICTIQTELQMMRVDSGTLFHVPLSYSSQIALSIYVKGLLELTPSLDAPDVITAMTRVERGEYSQITFDYVGMIPTDDELKIMREVMANSPQTEFEEMLVIMGLSEDRAKELVGLMV